MGETKIFISMISVLLSMSPAPEANDPMSSTSAVPKTFPIGYSPQLFSSSSSTPAHPRTIQEQSFGTRPVSPVSPTSGGAACAPAPSSRPASCAAPFGRHDRGGVQAYSPGSSSSTPGASAKGSFPKASTAFRGLVLDGSPRRHRRFHRRQPFHCRDQRWHWKQRRSLPSIEASGRPKVAGTLSASG